MHLLTNIEKSVLVLLGHVADRKQAAHQVKPIAVVYCKEDVLMGLFGQVCEPLSARGGCWVV